MLPMHPLQVGSLNVSSQVPGVLLTPPVGPVRPGNLRHPSASDDEQATATAASTSSHFASLDVIA